MPPLCPRNYSVPDFGFKAKLIAWNMSGSVSNLLVERMPGFVLSLESQKVNLAQFQE